MPCLSLLLAVVTALPLQGDPAKDIKSKDFEVRLAAVEVLAGGHDKAEKLLVGALKDKDWEVMEAAAAALGRLGEAQGGGKASMNALLKLSLGGPTQRIRGVAASALAQAHGAAGYEALLKKMSGKTAIEASRAASAFWPVLDGKAELKGLEKIWNGKENDPKAAAHAIVMLAGPARPAKLRMVLEGPSVVASASALEAVAQTGDVGCLTDVLSVIDKPANDLLKRRAVSTTLALLAQADDTEPLLSELFDGLEQADAAHAAPHYARILTKAVHREFADADDIRKRFLKVLEQRTEIQQMLVRAAVVDALSKLNVAPSASDQATAGALGFLGGSSGGDQSDSESTAGGKSSAHPDSIKALVEAIRNDPSFLVRSAAIRSLARMLPADDVVRANTLIEAMQNDQAARNREDAAVALGVKGQKLAAPALIKALQDEDRWVAVVSAVSLGMTQDPRAVQPLTDLLQHEDWRMRGAALTGLARSYLKEAVPPLISGLEDVDETVRRTAHQHLTALAHQQIEPTVEAWTAWWNKVKRAYQLFDPEEAKRRSEKYGYAGLDEQGTATLFKDQDVIVFQSRGDHMEHVLDALKIQHEKTAYGKLAEAKLHPRAVFVVNCTGEIDAKDIDRIGWFVRTGGYLLGSCWALHETIARVYPGVVARYKAPGEVMDTVQAQSCAPDSPFLREVFPPGVKPIYSLVGAHLIQIIDPQRCEVLVDSAQCAERWGNGNLAVWFPAGHGIILDSVNHFEEQGLGNAPWLKKPEQRQAFAMDHMGMSYEEWRETRSEKYWSKGGQVAREVLDLSVFRLISNFVRRKRISGE